MEEESKLKKTKTIKGKALTIYIIVIVVISMAISFGCGYMLSEKLNNKTNKKSEEKVETKNKVKTVHDLNDGEIDINNQEIQEYFELFKVDNYFEDEIIRAINDDSGENESTINRAKIFMTFLQVKNNEFFDIKCGELSQNTMTDNYFYCGRMNEEMSKYYAENNFEEFNKAMQENTTKAIKGETIKNYFELYFGKGSFKKHEQIISKHEAAAYIYSDSNDTYGIYYVEGGGTGPTITQNLSKVTKNDDLLVLDIFSKYDDVDNSGNTIILTLKWDKEINRYVFESRKVA